MYCAWQSKGFQVDSSVKRSDFPLPGKGKWSLVERRGCDNYVKRRARNAKASDTHLVAGDGDDVRGDDRQQQEVKGCDFERPSHLEQSVHAC